MEWRNAQFPSKRDLSIGCLVWFDTRKLLEVVCVCAMMVMMIGIWSNGQRPEEI